VNRRASRAHWTFSYCMSLYREGNCHIVVSDTEQMFLMRFTFY